MKKLSFLMLALLCFVSCKEGPMGPQGPAGRDGKDGKDGLVNFQILDFEVKQNGWNYSGPANSTDRDNNYFYCTFDIPKLTADIYDNGVVAAYIEYGTGTADAVQHQLPLVQHIEMEDAGTMYFYTATTDYEYGVGQISFFYTLSDFYYEVDVNELPPAAHFRVVLMW